MRSREDISNYSAYMFESADSMFSAARAALESGYCDKSAAYEGLGAYYLLTVERNAADPRFSYALSGYYGEKIKNAAARSAVSEFGVLLPDIGSSFVEEHCRCIFSGNAVEKLAAFSE